MTCTATCLASTIALESILQNPIAKLPVIISNKTHPHNVGKFCESPYFLGEEQVP
jgi:hypothetical protein